MSESETVQAMREQLNAGIQEGLIEPMQVFYPTHGKINRDQSNDIAALLTETLLQLKSVNKTPTADEIAGMLKEDPETHKVLISLIDTMKSLERDDFNLLMDLFKGDKTYEE